LTGSQGPQGVQGDQGSQGATGAQGFQGNQGSPGQSTSFFKYLAKTTLYTGNPGTSYLIWNNVTQTSASQINISHLTSDSVDIDVFLSLLAINDAIIIQDQADSNNYQRWIISSAITVIPNSYVEIPVTYDTGTYTFSDNEAIIVALQIKGPTGAQGPQGITGAQGSQGATGPQGDQGSQGVQGPQGDQGAQGFQGDQGVQGDQGTQGFQGDQGTQGDQGPQGDQGDQGFQGDQGTQGFQGDQGSQGTQGFQGDQGTQGFQGDQGTQGVQGDQGTQGFQGVQGLTGSQGTQGDQGTQGVQGATGSQGPQGITGAQGSQGSTGAQGPQGFQGDQGTPNGSFGIVIDGAGSPITTGEKASLIVPYDGVITSWTILADVSGSIEIDIWKDSYANYPPTIGDSIVGAAYPTLSSAIKATDSTLSGWTTSFSNGDIFRFVVNSASTVTKVVLSVQINKI
jgi:hypothetical protein